MAKIITRGEPGTVWTNETNVAQYQFHVNGVNTCGLCYQFDGNIAASWGIPLHRGCRCHVTLIRPNATSAPFVDFREEIAALPRSQQTKVVGRAALTLIDRGVVPWNEVVTTGRVRTLREVVARQGLTVKAMVKAGVNSVQAAKAFESVNTPAHLLAEADRRALIAKLLGKGVTPAEIKGAVSPALASRVRIGAGPSGPSRMPVRPPWMPLGVRNDVAIEAEEEDEDEDIDGE